MSVCHSHVDDEQGDLYDKYGAGPSQSSKADKRQQKSRNKKARGGSSSGRSLDSAGGSPLMSFAPHAQPDITQYSLNSSGGGPGGARGGALGLFCTSAFSQSSEAIASSANLFIVFHATLSIVHRSRSRRL